MEKIVASILPDAALRYVSEEDLMHPRAAERPTKRIFLAEDSSTIRQAIVDVLHAGGYTHVTTFTNGRAAYDALCEAKRDAESTGADLSDQVDILISDIEMPQMDGLTLCKKCKRELALPIPVILFSSLINDQMARKCESVGADGHMAKPEIEKLIGLMDSLCLTPEPVGAQG